MSRLPQRYPRRTVQVDVAQLRRNTAAICERARLDRVVILRCGKPTWAIVHYTYFKWLERIAVANEKDQRDHRGRCPHRQGASRAKRRVTAQRQYLKVK
jgi:hypothetical protein